MFDSTTEGIDHINCYSKSKTILGKYLSNFAYTPFTCNGVKYASMEAAWYAFGLPLDVSQNLRKLHGFLAKAEGRKLRQDYPPDQTKPEAHQLFMRQCADQKLKEHPRILILLKNNKLPLVHYYEYGGKVVTSNGSDWLWKHYETYMDTNIDT